MKKFLTITCLILLTTAVILTAYFGIKPSFKKTPEIKNSSSSLISHLKIEPEIKQREIKIPVILYHYVRNIAPQPDHLGWNLSISPTIFQQQMEYLKKENYTTITPHDLHEYLKYGHPLPNKPILLTFDDGYLDFFEEVLPVLKDYNLNATNFVVTNFIGHKNYMDWYHLRYLLTTDHVFLGAHTQNHKKLTQLNPEKLEQEIAVNKMTLEEWLGTAIDYLAYPYGNYNDEVLSIVKKHKFKAAFTTEPSNIHKTSELLKLPRIKIGGGDNIQTLAEKLTN